MDEETFQKTLEIYESQIKQRIINFLNIYNELSLTELSEKVGKSKSTVSKHIKELQDIKINDQSIIQMREQKHRGSIKQKIFSKANTPLFRGRTYSDIKEFSADEMYNHLHNEEFMINLRLFTLMRDIISQTVNYVNEFYSNLSPKDMDNKFKEKVYRYNTCIPRIQYYTKEEYLNYREKFLKFDEQYLAEVEEKRKSNNKSSTEPKEYLVCNALLPIRRIFDKEYE